MTEWSSLISANAIYHVPRSQVWQGSRSRQAGCAHLHVAETFVRGRITRYAGQSLCGKVGWYERPAETDDRPCPRCMDMASRYGVRVPVGVGADA